MDRRPPKAPLDPDQVSTDEQPHFARPCPRYMLQIEDPDSYSGTGSRLGMASLNWLFFRFGFVLKMSVGLKPNALLLPSTMENPEGADPHGVDLKQQKSVTCVERK